LTVSTQPAAARFVLPTSAIHVWVCHLTARCNFACDYCIQKPGMQPGTKRRPWGRYDELSGAQWVDALNAFPVRPEHPLILTGGEPSLHRDFYFIASHLEGYDLDMTSNLTFDIERLAREMAARGKRFKTSFHTYHPKFMAPAEFLARAERLRDSGVVEQPTFSLVNLHDHPYFRDDEHDRNVAAFRALADQRGLTYQSNEFRGTHLGAPYDRQGKQRIECTSAWVNIAPDGDVFNCMYHLTERKHAFGNITHIAQCKTVPGMGAFFGCSDFGFCDPCHENSGHGAFRDAKGLVFRRTKGDERVYLQWLQPEKIKDLAKRWAEAEPQRSAQAYLVAIGKGRAAGDPDDLEAWADLGLSLFDSGDKSQGLAALLHAIEGGIDRRDVLAAALLAGRELARLHIVRPVLAARVGADELVRLEQALHATLA
jgi:MoaA/NifB/PqqE/SkfB family radical SAM enzyme